MKKFGKYEFDELSDDQYIQLKKLKSRRNTKSNPSQYKIVITGDRCDYDNLSELMNHPERGGRVGTFYFRTPDQMEQILDAFEGLFFRLFRLPDMEYLDGGVLDELIYENWATNKCCHDCEFCFFKNKNRFQLWPPFTK